MSSSKSKQGENKQSLGYAFKQQVMKAWQPVPTLNSTIWLFLVLSKCSFQIKALFFLIMGIVLISYTALVNEHYQRYDVLCLGGSTCNVDIAIDEDFAGPVYLYYELSNFYQNHRRYLKSKDTTQMSGTNQPISALTNCNPAYTNADLNKNLSVGVLQADGSYTNQVVLNPSDPAIPCGLIAKSLFNGYFKFYSVDTFLLYSRNNQTKNPIFINQTNIAWPSDLNGRYQNVPNFTNLQWIDMAKNEHFMVWMRTAALPTFRKLWGRIDSTLSKGKYTYNITNNFDVSQFDGSKSLVLSTANAFGGKNNFLSIAYLVVGVICALITIGFTIRKFLTTSSVHKNK